MTSDQPRSQQIFESNAGPLPRLKMATAPEAGDMLEADEAQAAARPRSSRSASGAVSREVVLRIVEAVKAL